MRYFALALIATLPGVAATGQTLVRQSTAPPRQLRADEIVLPSRARPPSLSIEQRSAIAKQLTGNPQADASAAPLRFEMGAKDTDPALFLYNAGIVSTSMSSVAMTPTSAAGFRLRAPGEPPLAGVALFVCSVSAKEPMTWAAYPKNYGQGIPMLGGPVQRTADHAVFTVDLAMIDDALAIRLSSEKSPWTFHACSATLLK